MRIDPLLAGLVTRLFDQLGDFADQARHAELPPSVAEWQNRDVIDFIDRLRQVTNDDYMGLAAAPCAVGTADFVIELGTRCETLREAIDIGFRLMKIATSAFEFELRETGGLAVISICPAISEKPVSSVLSTWVPIAWHKLLQWLIDAEIPLEKAEFPHKLDSPFTDYAAMFCGNCIFNSDASRLVFARSYLDRRVVRLPHEGDRLKATTPGYFAKPGLIARSWTQLVRNALRGQLARQHAPPSIDVLAREFGISTETLRRRLRAEGAGYRALKAESREEAARHVLIDLNANLGMASIGAGFSEPNSLTRALKRNRGISSVELRAEVLGKKDPG